MKKELLLLTLGLLEMACNRGSPGDCPYTGIAEGRCAGDTLNAYHFIRPQQSSVKFPLLLVLDSGGDGLLAVEKTRPAVSGIPCVVMGSDLVRNNFPGFGRAIEELIREALQKFPVSKDLIFLAGFSGGARMALEYSRQHPVKGVLMCGAGPGADSFRDLPCPVYMIAGTRDFNFPEMYYNPLQTGADQGFMSDYFRGGHEWPPPDKLRDGLLWLAGNTLTHGKEMAGQESAQLYASADSLRKQKDILFEVKAVEKSLRFNPRNKPAREQMRKFRNTPEYARYFSRVESDLDLEARIRQAYLQATAEKDSSWWSNEIRQLNREIEGSSGDKRDHFVRIKGTIGILFFFRLNSLLHTEPGDKQIPHLLAAYRLAEPQNPDVYYFRALYDRMKGDGNGSRRDLSRAISLGFADQERLGRDFPETLTATMK